MKALAVQNRTVAVMDNGTWAATAGKQIVKQLEEMKNMTVLDQKLSVKSTLKSRSGRKPGCICTADY